MRELILAALFAVAGLLIVVGVAEWFSPAGWIVAGVALAGWSWLFLGDVE